MYGGKVLKTITIEQWDSADIAQRSQWLDDDVLLDEEGMEILSDRIEEEIDNSTIRIAD